MTEAKVGMTGAIPLEMDCEVVERFKSFFSFLRKAEKVILQRKI